MVKHGTMTRFGTSRRAAALAFAVALALAPAAAHADDLATASGGPFTAIGGPVLAHDAAAAKLPRDAARLVSCKRSLRPDGRAATVLTTMRPVRHATHFAVRIDLYQRPLAGGAWTLRSDVPGLGAWLAPNDPKLGSRPKDVFEYRQSIGRLAYPFAYRFRAAFRWSDDSGAIVRQAQVRTLPCREPDLRPDLRLTDVTILPSGMMPLQGQPTLVRYRVGVTNGGHRSAHGVAVQGDFLTGGVDAPQTRTLALVRPGERFHVSFVAPTCAALDAPPSFTVDPGNTVDEANEANNTLLATC
jgi:hypothetical protein